MINDLMEEIEEQSSFGFTGRINIIENKTNQLLGMLLMKEGDLRYAKFRKFYSDKALIQLVNEWYHEENLSYVCEPEDLDKHDENIHIPINKLIPHLKKNLEISKECVKLRPPNTLKLAISNNALLSDIEITSEEFDTLCTISDNCKVNEIYAECSLLEHQITLALVSLRQKGLIKVLGNN